jgi:hypothetical protein
VVESSRKWPESGLVVQIPCSPVTLCRDLRVRFISTCLLLHFKILTMHVNFRFRHSKRISYCLLPELPHVDPKSLVTAINT